MLRIIYIGIVLIIQGSAINAQPLEQILEEVLRGNAGVKAMDLMSQSQFLKAEQVGQLPDPQIGLGVPILRPETRLGPQVLAIGASQMIPWFGSLEAKKDLIKLQAGYSKENIRIRELDLLFLTKQAYYILFSLEQTLDLINENIEIFKSLERISLSKVESGQGSLADVLRIQVSISNLESELQQYEIRKKKFRAQINSMRNQPMDTAVEIFEPDLVFNSVSIEASSFDRNHPEFQKLNWLNEISSKRLELNDLDSKPDFSVGLDYILVTQRTDADPLQNGKDILMPKIMVSMPINKSKNRLLEQEERLKKESYDQEFKHIENQFSSQLVNFQVAFEEALISIALKEEQIETLEVSINMMTETYSHKGTHFIDLLELRKEIIRYKREIIMAKVDALNAIAGIEKISSLR